MIPSVRRILVALLALIAIIAGCVGSAPAASGSAGAPITKAQAVAFARAVNLTKGDLHGATAEEVQASEPESSLSKIVRCAHSGTVARPVDEETSVLFVGHNFVASLVRLMPSAAVAAAELASLASGRGHVCFASAAKAEETGYKETPPIRATFVPLVKLLGAGAIGVHTLSEFPGGPKSSVLHASVVLFRVGPAEIVFLTLGPRQFPPATEGRLLALLHGRAEAHELELS